MAGAPSAMVAGACSAMVAQSNPLKKGKASESGQRIQPRLKG